MSSFSAFLLVAFSAAAFAADCPCNNRNFLVRRVIPFTPAPGGPTIQQIIWGVMNDLYTTDGGANTNSAFTVFKKSLARDEILRVRSQDFEFRGAPDFCMHGSLKGAQFMVGDSPRIYQADIEFKGNALTDGVSTEICNCKQTAGSGVDICNDLLRKNTNDRMDDVAAKFA